MRRAVPTAAIAWRTLLVALALLIVAPGSLAAQQAPAEAALLPELDPGAPQGAELTARINRAFDRYALPVGPFTRGKADVDELEGRVIRSAYRLADPQATTAAVMDGYRTRLEALGYTPLFACENMQCGSFDFRFAIELLPPPAMLMDVADFAQLSARRGTGAQATHLSVLVSRLLGAVYIQTVAVAPATPGIDVAPATAAAPSGALRAMQPGAEKALLERLTGFGHVRLQGLAFEPGSAALTPESAAALDLVARALAARPNLSVLVVGHSDNQGSLDDNISLSQRRAEAVRDALVARGIDAARLEAHGTGFLAPVASNATEEGRALNRRVELVLR